MRHVFSDNDTIAELWATQAQDYARNKRYSFYFTGKTIYSYGEHFPIAILGEKYGRKFIIYNSRTYGITTTRHQNTVWWAMHRHLRILRRLNLPMSDGGVDYDNWIHEKQAIIQQFICDLQNPGKIKTPTKADFENVVNLLNEAAYYLFNNTNPFHLKSFIRPSELKSLLAQAEERKTYRESKQNLKRAFGCSDYVANKILQQASRKAA